MAKTELPASRGTEAFYKAVKKITDSVRAQREKSVLTARKLSSNSSGDWIRSKSRPQDQK